MVIGCVFASDDAKSRFEQRASQISSNAANASALWSGLALSRPCYAHTLTATSLPSPTAGAPFSTSLQPRAIRATCGSGRSPPVSEANQCGARAWLWVSELSGCSRFKGEIERAVSPTSGGTATPHHPHHHPPACPVDCAPQERNRQRPHAHSRRAAVGSGR